MAKNILTQIQISKNTSIPIYQQLESQLESLIVNGTWRLRDPLPSETLLAHTLGISVMTVRQAMAQLVNKGLIYREKGRGTFITPQPLEHHLQRLESFSEDMRARSLQAASRILAFEVTPAPEKIAQTLAQEAGSPILHVKRLRLTEDHPVALHDAYVVRTDIERARLEEVGSLYAVLEEIGSALVEAEETLEAVVADGETAALLGIQRGDPLLMVTRLSSDREHQPVELVTALYRADFYRYTVRLHR
jgi:GntR family transcriptional regulator